MKIKDHNKKVTKQVPSRTVAEKHNSKLARKASLIVALASNPNIGTQRQIAEIAGVREETVSRVISANKDTLEELKQRLDEYDSKLSELLPVSERAAIYVQIARENVVRYPMAALKALERIDNIHGIVTEVDKVRVKLLDTTIPKAQPMFLMPPGSYVRVTRAEFAPIQTEEPPDVVVSDTQPAVKDDDPT